MSRSEYRGSFDCEASDGRVRTIKHFVNVVDVGSRSRGETKDGLGEIHCEGEVVHHVKKGHYQTMAGINITTDDPNAP